MKIILIAILMFCGVAFAQTVPEGFVWVEGGTFQMGSNNGEDDEKPAHSVTVSGFYMAKYEVTQKEWREVMKTKSIDFKGDNLPVENVSWYDAVEYCNKRSIKEGLTPAYRGSKDSITFDRKANGYRLPPRRSGNMPLREAKVRWAIPIREVTI